MNFFCHEKNRTHSSATVLLSACNIMAETIQLHRHETYTVLLMLESGLLNSLSDSIILLWVLSVKSFKG